MSPCCEFVPVETGQEITGVEIFIMTKLLLFTIFKMDGCILGEMTFYPFLGKQN